MKIVNLTPHALHLYNEAGEKVATIPPSGTVARVSVERRRVGEIDGIPVYTARYGRIEGLPRPRRGTIYVVSGMVKAAVPGRGDVYQPGELKRDLLGRVVGAVGLVR